MTPSIDLVATRPSLFRPACALKRYTFVARRWHSVGVGLLAAACLLIHAGAAQASPAVQGTRNVALGGASRASAYGSSAALVNASNMSFAPTFAIEPMYQVAIRARTHGAGIVVMDSLANPRFSLGLGYLFMKGSPQIRYTNTLGERKSKTLDRFGHEAFLSLGFVAVKQWLALGLTPRYQYTSLRFRDGNGVAHNANSRLSAFGLDASTTVNVRRFAALALVVTNVAGAHRAPYTDARNVELTGLNAVPNTVDHRALPEVSEYPLSFAHGLAVFPFGSPKLSLNFDGAYDFTTYKFEKYTRMTYAGSAEFIAGPVPIRFGTTWDGRGKGKSDDLLFVSGGVSYLKTPKSGSLGVDVGFAFSQQVTNANKETLLTFNLGLLLHPDL